MFKQYTKKEQMQNELQWWGEQWQEAVNNGNHKDREHTKKMIDMLVNDIQREERSERRRRFSFKQLYRTLFKKVS